MWRILVVNFEQFDAILVDYLHKRKFPILGPLCSWLLRAATAGVLVGVYQFNTNDIGAFSPVLLRRIYPLAHGIPF